MSVWFREFPDGTFELGILEDYFVYKIMDVGDFAYGININLDQWTYIGEL